MKFRTLAEAPVESKTVLLRTDFNLPIKDGKVQDDTRLRESLPTLQELIRRGAKVVIVTHLGRPKGVTEDLRLDLVASTLSSLLGQTVQKLSDCIGPEVKAAIAGMKGGDVLLLENVRFHPEEEANDPVFAKALAEGCDLYVNDAFGTIHRAHASTVGVAQFLPAYAGLLVAREVEVLSSILENPKKPVTLVAGGAKIDTKIGILEKFLSIADTFLIGGALANTFLAAQGYGVGTSLCENDKITTAKQFLEQAATLGKKVFLPVDVMIATDITPGLTVSEVEVNAVPGDQKILDLGTQTIALFVAALQDSRTILWNGPMGLYENPAFEKGTRGVAEAIAETSASKVLGGGDSIDAINHFGIPHEKYTHISTGGGAMLEFLEGKMLPGVQVLLS
jgi:phosphoglycerate kinase